MAISLERMRELEEKVREIPSLYDQIESLKNERSNLSSKLDEIRRTLREREERLDQFKKGVTKFSSSPEKKFNVRDIGVSCAVLMRDVGISSIARKLKSAETMTNGYLEVEKPKLISVKSQIRPEIQTKSTITDLYMRDMKDDSDKKSKRLSLKDLDIVSESPRIPEKSSKGIQAVLKEPITILQVIERREIGVQVEESAKSCRDAGMIAKPTLTNASVDARPKTRDAAVSEDKTSDLLCDRCKSLKTRNIGIGLGNVKLTEAELLKNSLPERSRSFHFANTSKPKQTRNVGTGTLTPVKKLTASKNVDTSEFSASRTKHIGMNTNKYKLVDTGTVTDSPRSEICEKCKSGAKTPVKGILVSKDSVDSQQKENQPSKIPRPKSLSTTPVMERKKFLRQDTYTKVSPTMQKSFSKEEINTEKKTKARCLYIFFCNALFNG